MKIHQSTSFLLFALFITAVRGSAHSDEGGYSDGDYDNGGYSDEIDKSLVMKAPFGLPYGGNAEALPRKPGGKLVFGADVLKTLGFLGRIRDVPAKGLTVGTCPNPETSVYYQKATFQSTPIPDEWRLNLEVLLSAGTPMKRNALKPLSPELYHNPPVKPSSPELSPLESTPLRDEGPESASKAVSTGITEIIDGSIYTLKSAYAGWKPQMRVAAGEFGTVFLAVSVNDGTSRAAIKLIPKVGRSHFRPQVGDAAAAQMAANAFTREAMIHKEASKRTRFVIKFIDAIFDDPDFWILIMEYAEGGSLFDSIEKGYPKSEEDLRRLTKQLVEGFCHFIYT